MFIKVGLLAYLINRILDGWHAKKHPITYMQEYIQWFKKEYYQDDVRRGTLLTLSLIGLTFFIAHVVALYIGYMSNIYVQTLLFSLVGSTMFASKTLYDSLKAILTDPYHSQSFIKRDTHHLTQSEIYKIVIETYTKHLNDWLIAPLFYLILFGLEGAFVYRAIHTLGTMVSDTHNFAKTPTKVTTIADYIPSRITALLIALFMGSQKALLQFYHDGTQHDNPNEGIPIAAMAFALGIRLGGDSFEQGELKKQATLGEGRREITADDIVKALNFFPRFTVLVIIVFVVALVVQ